MGLACSSPDVCISLFDVAVDGMDGTCVTRRAQMVMQRGVLTEKYEHRIHPRNVRLCTAIVGGVYSPLKHAHHSAAIGGGMCKGV